MDLIGSWLEHINSKKNIYKKWNVITNWMMSSNYFNHDNNIVIVSVKDPYFAQINTERFSFKTVQCVWRGE